MILCFHFFLKAISLKNTGSMSLSQMFRLLEDVL